MPVPQRFQGVMSLPAIAAPMFLVSGPELVRACCRTGVAGSFPALNARSNAVLGEWLGALDEVATDPQCAPYGVNLILHASNTRVEADLALLVEHRCPFVITSLGHPGQVVEAVHGYGGLVFSDVIHAHHAKKAIAAGVDGIVAVASGAGGHAGTQSPFSLVREIREFWDGVLVLGGAISDGATVRAAELLGADFAYLGTRFIATRESMAPDAYKQMLVDSSVADIVYTDAVSGTDANFLWPSLERAGFDRAQLSRSLGKGKLKDLADEAKAWRDLWSAGHGVATIHDVPPVAELVARLSREYREACAQPGSAACRGRT
ncbi:MAG: nitronate monooxygenase [Rhodocyclaceae bacterium]|nr:nitronate monooxygenase [Rhodocyclaceae bacterium]